MGTAFKVRQNRLAFQLLLMMKYKLLNGMRAFLRLLNPLKLHMTIVVVVAREGGSYILQIVKESRMVEALLVRVLLSCKAATMHKRLAPRLIRDA
jgi:hypothetical protein